MKKKIELLKKQVIKKSKNPSFIHHKWFVKYHLEIVEKISLELCQKYQKADRYTVLALVWIHDYGKMIDFSKQYEMTPRAGKKLMEKIGFEEEFINTILQYVGLLDKKMKLDISKTPIEVKIVSSADAASHMIGPFYRLYWYENPNKKIEDLMKGDFKKSKKDWGRKIVLPEVKRAFKDRYQALLEKCGNFPKKYLK